MVIIELSRLFPSANPSITSIDMPNRANHVYKIISKRHAKYNASWYMILDSSGYPSGSPSDNPTKDTSPVLIINPSGVPRNNPTKDPYHVPK